MSLRKPRRLKPRKLPSQARAHQTVDIILEAAAQVLQLRGYSGTTTNRVAERAGLSIGTIYEYFPNKDAMLAELQSRWSDKTYETFHATATADGEPISLRDGLRRVIEARIAATTLDTKLHSALQNDVPFRGNQKTITDRLSELRSLNIQSMENRKSEFRVDDMEMLSDLLMFGLHGYFDNLALRDPSRLCDETLVDRLTDMVHKLISVNDD